MKANPANPHRITVLSMIPILGRLFSVPDAPRRWYQIIIWWELGRTRSRRQRSLVLAPVGAPAEPSSS